MPPVVAIVARAPSRAGKSRLMRELETSQGEGLRRALLLDTLAAVAPVEAAKVILHTPAEADGEMRALTPFDATFLPQSGETLGDRMRNAVAALLGQGFDRVILVGADLPALPTSHVTAAFALLEPTHADVVVAPADDGGYSLIGVRAVYDELFDGIAWGTAAVLGQTLDAAAARGLRVERLPPCYDVDRLTDLRRLWREAREGVALHTRAWVASAEPAVRAAIESQGL